MNYAALNVNGSKQTPLKVFISGFLESIVL
jgi:hypothetical protein